jgi:hypothetical protein
MLDLSTGSLVSGLILGMVGFLMFLYGKRNEEPLVLAGGIALSLLPMFLHAMIPLWAVSAAVLVVVILLRGSTGAQPLA